MDDEDFRHTLFTEPEEYEESPLRDRKSELPDLRHNEKKAEFIKDVIALANTARMFGKPAYLLYGLDDDGQLCDIIPSACWLDDVKGLTLGEKMQHKLQEVIGRHIKPSVKWEFKVSEIDAKRVAYLLVCPIPTNAPYQVKEQIPPRGQPLLRPGQCWIRFGESKSEIERKEIAPDEDPYRYSYSQVPYVLPSMWKAYFSGLYNDRNIDPKAAQSIKLYQDLYDRQGRLLQYAVENFLCSSERMLIISGAAGSGKSAFIRRLVADLAQNGSEVMGKLIRDESFRPPPCWIPVYLPLRDEPVNSSWKLERRLLDLVNSVSGNAFFGVSEKRPECPEVLLRNPQLKWLICLDGLDELDTEGRQKNFLSQLQVFKQEFARLKIILSTRPDVIDDQSLDQFGEVVRIAPLDREQILAYIRGHLSGEDEEQTFRELLELLGREPELWKVLSSPACLEAAIPEIASCYPNSLEPPSASTVSHSAETPDLTREMLLAKAKKAYRSKRFSAVNEQEVVWSEPYETEAEQRQRLHEPPGERVTNLLALHPARLLDGVFRGLWQREGKRRRLNPHVLRSWWEALGGLALQWDGQHESDTRDEILKSLRRYSCRRPEDCFHQLFSLGILVYEGPLGLARFSHEIVKAYFATSRVRTLIEARKSEKVREHLSQSTEMFREKVLCLLEPLVSIDLHTLFNGGEP